MEENSRSDAINDLKDMIYKNNSDDVIEKAISDMEKLEKIEKIVEEMWDENSYYNNTVRFAEMIEQILRGGEDGRD